MIFKVLIPLYKDEVSPRFDLSVEALIVHYEEKVRKEEKTIVLQRASSEDLCYLILVEKIDIVICGGIEDEYYQYLKWKKVEVIDSVAGTVQKILLEFENNSLKSGSITFNN